MEHLYQLFRQHRIVSTDSRNIVAGCLFFALKGENFNGNAFALQALEAGAAYAIVDDPALPAHPQLHRVEDVLSCLQELALYHRRQLNLPVVAITGTNGKTTTKELVARVLAVRYRTGVTKGNLNNHIGVPLTLLTMDTDTQIAVVEMGASHPGEIAVLCRIAEPNYGLVTNVGKAHLEGFGSLEGVKRTKGELYDYLSRSAGTILYNNDNPILCEMVAARQPVRTVEYGVRRNKASLLASNAEHPFLRLQVEDYPGINTQLIGSYNTDNVLAALAVGRQFGITPEEAAGAIAAYVPSNNRSQLSRTDRHTVIMDAYNANPTSMAAAIDNFAQLKEDNKWLILGDMLELGTESDTEHRQLIHLLQEKGLTQSLLVGLEFMKVKDAHLYRTFANVEELNAWLQNNPLPSGAVVLLKGSRGIKLEQALKAL